MSAIKLVGRQKSRVRANIKLKFDYWMLLTLAGLLVLGLIMVYSSSFDYGVLYKNGDATYYFRRQLTALGIGLAGILVIMQFDYHLFRRYSVPILGGTMILLFLILILGERILGAKRGLQSGSYQPSEVAKLAIILYIAHWLSSKGDRIKNLSYGLLPFSVITGTLCALIVQQPDLSTAALVAAISFTVYFVAGADWRQMSVAVLVGIVIFGALMWVLPHARGRVLDFTKSVRDPSQATWHVQQSLIALADGGWTGVGLGNGPQKFGLLPAAHTDSIFAVVGEELGVVGGLLVIGLLAVLMWRGLRAAVNARDGYGFLLALGIVVWFSYQALINIAVITSLVPFTGLPLPFLSYGGSSLAVSLFAVGILLNISRDAALDRRTRDWREQGARAQNTGRMEVSREAIGVRRRNRRPHLSGTGRRG